MKNNLLLNMTPPFKFDKSKLTEKDLATIKNFAASERSVYGIGPIGRDIFSFVQSKENLRVIDYKLNSENLDAMIFKYPSSKNTWIIINSNKPLIYQIFSIAHEYYHFKKDITSELDGISCDFNSTNLREIKANRFAAEFLLPTEAITEAINNIRILENKFDQSNYLNLVIQLSSRFCVPFNVTLFRLKEECDSLKDLDDKWFNENEKNIDEVLKTSSLFSELLSTKHHYLTNSNKELLAKLFSDGNITENEFIEMSSDLDLPEKFIDALISPLDACNDIEEEDIFSKLRESK